MKSRRLTPQRAHELLTYCRESGVLKWRYRISSKVKPDLIAGWLDEEGYRVVRVDGVNLRAHRVIWLMVHGIWPVSMLDHVNGDRADNRLSNLREATNSQNQMNKKNNGGEAGFKGVCVVRKKSGLRYRPQIYVDGKLKTFGLFKTPAEAHEVYKREALARFGEFARFK